MARGKKKESTLEKAEKTAFSKLKVLLAGSILSGGLGIGGCELTGHPILAAIVRFFTGEAKPGDGSLIRAIAQTMNEKGKKASEFGKEGAFEVTLEQLSLDPGVIGNERNAELRAMVVRYDDDGQRQVVWRSKNAAIVPGPEGKASQVVATFEDAPFELRWRPGDRIVVEVWSRRLLRTVKLFELANASSERFPLAPDQYPLKLVASGVRVNDPSNNTITFQARRLSGDDEAPSRVARDDDGSRGRTR